MHQVVRFLNKACRRWPNGIYAVWYPLLAANRWQEMVQAVAEAALGPLLRSELRVADENSGGMYGSGMLVLNPPWQLDRQLESLLPALAQGLGLSAGAATLEWLREPE